MGQLTKLIPTISLLEPRILFDGAAVATAVDVLDNNSFTAQQDDTPPASESSTRNKNEIAFIDTNIDGYQDIINDLDLNIEVHILDANSNGLEQIASFLEGKNNIDSIHIISHGSVGEISLGSTLLNEQTLSHSSEYLATIGNSLTQEGDILLYGCSVSSDGEGKEFIDSIADITSADVAASNDITGAQSIGGDWDLEYVTGTIESGIITSESYTGELALQSVSGLNDISIANDSTDIPINPSILIENGGNYGDGYIDFEVGTGLESGDTLVLQTTTGNPNDDGEISIVGSNVFLGREGSTTLIGTVDPVKNGLDGQPLRINFINVTVDDYGFITNGDFSEDISEGWTVIEERVNLGTPLPGTTIATPNDSDVTYPTALQDILDSRQATQDLSDPSIILHSPVHDDSVVEYFDDALVEITAEEQLKLEEVLIRISDPFGVIHGPAAYSDTFTGIEGMVLKFDWEANNIEDDYHVVGYLVDSSNNITIALDATGTTGSGTATAIIPSDGNYRFVFISGTFDATGGLIAGASMFLDNIRVAQPIVLDPVLEQLAKQVEYSNADASIDKVLTVSTRNILGTVASSDLNLLVNPVEKVTLEPIIPQTIPMPRASNIGEPTYIVENTEMIVEIPQTDPIELPKIISEYKEVQRSKESVVRTADVTVNVDSNGYISFHDTVENIDFRLQEISFSDDSITINIRDDYASQHEIYTGTYSNGKILPLGLSIDKHSGEIFGKIPDEMIDEEGNINIEISAYNERTNETRILKIKFNIADIKEATLRETSIAFLSLEKQFILENDKINNYGNNITKLFTTES